MLFTFVRHILIHSLILFSFSLFSMFFHILLPSSALIFGKGPSPVYLDEFRLWKRALTAAELSGAYARNSWPNNGILLYYSFATQTGTTIIDVSGNANDWPNAISSAFTWFNDFPLCIISTHISELAINIFNANGSFVLAPTTGFSPSVYSYDVLLSTPLPSSVQLLATWNQLPFSSAQLLLSSTGGVVNVPLTSGVYRSLTIASGTQAFMIIVTLPSDGFRYTFTVRSSAATAQPPCPSGQQDDGHVRFDGSAIVSMAPMHRNYIDIFNYDFTSVVLSAQLSSGKQGSVCF
jgi:hypothetical protein